MKLSDVLDAEPVSKMKTIKKMEMIKYTLII